MKGWDTSMGGPMAEMPSTRWDEFLSLSPGSVAYRAFLNQWMTQCWKPIYAYIRVGWTHENEDAKDLTQEFLAHFLEKNYLATLRPERGTLRGYVKTALRHFLQNRRRDEKRVKRGGGAKPLPLDEAIASEKDPRVPDDAAAKFDRDWAAALFESSVKLLGLRLAVAGKQRVFEVFRSYHLPDRAGDAVPDLFATQKSPRYGRLAERFGMTVSEVAHALEEARKDLKEILRAHVRGTVGSETEADEELRALFGI